MACGTLFTYPENFRAFKALIAAEYSGFKLNVDPNFCFGETNKSEEFLKKFPLGKVPTFTGSDGLNIFESNAIAYHVSNSDLRGNNPVNTAMILQWINFADNEILPASCNWTFPCLGIMQYNKQNTEHAKEEIKRTLSILNNHLSTRTFLVGEQVTLADICVITNLLQLYKLVLDPDFRKPFPHTNRWFITCVNQTQFKAIVKEVILCTKMAQFDSKKWAEFSGQGKKKEKAQVNEQSKKEIKKKETVVEDTAAEGDVVEKKPKDPFSLCPETQFNFDEFKRVYSNEDTLTKAIPYFWEKFDPETMSLWYCEYKYPEDLKQVFMSCNLIGGLFQRLEKMVKNSFASVILFGDDKKSSISGVWFWRGHDLAFKLSPDWQIDFESYEWKKLDPKCDDTKLLVKEYFSWEGDFAGKTFNQGKIFK